MTGWTHIAAAPLLLVYSLSKIALISGALSAALYPFFPLRDYASCSPCMPGELCPIMSHGDHRISAYTHGANGTAVRYCVPGSLCVMLNGAGEYTVPRRSRIVYGPGRINTVSVPMSGKILRFAPCAAGGGGSSSSSSSSSEPHDSSISISKLFRGAGSALQHMRDIVAEGLRVSVSADPSLTFEARDWQAAIAAHRAGLHSSVTLAPRILGGFGNCTWLDEVLHMDTTGEFEFTGEWVADGGGIDGAGGPGRDASDARKSVRMTPRMAKILEHYLGEHVGCPEGVHCHVAFDISKIVFF